MPTFSPVLRLEELERCLRQSLDGLRLGPAEREQLRALGSILEIEQARFVRNRAFALARERLAASPQDALAVLKWLENVIRTLDTAVQRQRITATAHFSPGRSCRSAIRELVNATRHTLDICVFTITDREISRPIIRAHQRDVAVRVITDDVKSHDLGSDIHDLVRAGVPVVMDDSPFFMHHKFAIFDGSTMLTGSYNWTRSASEFNQENLVVSDNKLVVASFQSEFDKLWKAFGSNRIHDAPRTLVPAPGHAPL